MSRQLPLVVLCAALLGLVATGATAGSTPGVTAKSILLGGTVPLSGPLSSFSSVAKGADAYFRYVNAGGGVNGRQITYKYLDDQYDPFLTVQATKQLVQQDKVFAIFNALGTEQNLATRAFLNALDVPQLFVASGANTWGRDYKRFPWSIGFLPSYTAEGAIYGKYLTKTKPKARIAVLYQSDDYTKDLIAGLKKGLGGKGRIVAQEGYDPTASDVGAQVARLKSSNADTFMVFATGKFAIQALVYANRFGWKTQAFVNQVASASQAMVLASEGGSNKRTEGAISIVFIKDPTSPKWAKDPGVVLYKRIMRTYAKGVNPRDVYNAYGMAAAFTMVDTLKRAGRNPTRQSVMSAALHLNERNNPFLLPGIDVQTSPTNHFPVVKAQLQRWHVDHWVPFGGLVNARSQG